MTRSALTQPIQRHLDTVSVRSPKTDLTWAAPQENWRHFAQLIVIVSGRGEVQLKDSRLSLTAGDLVWLPPGLMVSAEFRAGAQADLVTVSEDWLIPAISHRLDSDVPLRAMPETIHTVRVPEGDYPQRIRHCIDSLRFELNQSAQGARAVVAAQFTSLLTYVFRLGETDLLAQQTGPLGSVIYQRFLQLVELHFRDHWPVRDYAAAMGVTTRRLESAAQRDAGESPRSVIQRKLLSEACLRLAHSPLSVTEVAYGLGFRDPAYFNRFFRKLTGKAPGEWRRAIRAEQVVVDETFAAWP